MRLCFMIMCIERFALHATRSQRSLALVIISLDRDDYSPLVTISLDRDDYSPLDTRPTRKARGQEAANARPRSITIESIIGS